MIVLLFLTTLVIAFIVAAIVAWIFAASIDSILNRVVGDELSHAWARYMRFAIRVFELRKTKSDQ